MEELQGMYPRKLSAHLIGLLNRHPAVALLGPRQAGKTTLALELARGRPSMYLDLESPADLAKLTEPELFLAMHEDKLLILDEIQRAPDLFAVLRGIIDKGRREGRATGRFLLLGSAAMDLLQQSAESLAGRIAYVELGPLQLTETGAESADRLWLRGGFPPSLLAESDAASLEWRQAFIRTYLERDIPQLGPRVPAETLRRLWTMLAYEQGGIASGARLAAALGLSGQTVGRYIDLLCDLMLVRRLTPWAANTTKRLVRTPKVYVRDSGLIHALLGLTTLDHVLSHPVAGMSWEGWVIESLLAAAPSGTISSYYRTAAGAEIDLVLELPRGRRWALECKRSLNPAPARGFHEGCKELRPERKLVIYPGSETIPLGQEVEAISLSAALALLEAAAES